MGLTNCLNFGDPEDPQVAWQFRRTVAGVAAAARALGVPVTGGNVSFYNAYEGQAVYPTPVVGMVGRVDGVHRLPASGFVAAGDVLVLVGPVADDLGGSEYLAAVWGQLGRRPPGLDLALERRVQRAVRQAVQAGWVASAHDLAEGGLLAAVVESVAWAAPGAAGARLVLAPEPGGALRPDSWLFGETPSRVLLSLAAADLARWERLARRWRVPWRRVGEVETGVLAVTWQGQTLLAGPADWFVRPWRESVAAWLGDRP